MPFGRPSLSLPHLLLLGHLACATALLEGCNPSSPPPGPDAAGSSAPSVSLLAPPDQDSAPEASPAPDDLLSDPSETSWLPPPVDLSDPDWDKGEAVPFAPLTPEETSEELSKVKDCGLSRDDLDAKAEILVQQGVPPLPLKDALDYYFVNCPGLKNRRYLAIVDYGIPAPRPRLFVADLAADTVEQDLVAHGIGSGMGAVPRVFSNAIGSNASSLGFFRTAGDIRKSTKVTGPVLELEGLTPSLNGNALDKRGLLIHQVAASPADWRRFGFIPSTDGCLGVLPQRIQAILDRLRDGALVYTYQSKSSPKDILKRSRKLTPR